MLLVLRFSIWYLSFMHRPCHKPLCGCYGEYCHDSSDFLYSFVGIRADYTRDKVKWMTYSGLFQAVLFFLAALVVQQASLFAFSSLCLINVISDVISDFAGGLRIPLIKEKVAEDDLMEAYSFLSLSPIFQLLVVKLSVWLLGLSVNNFSLVAESMPVFPRISRYPLFRKKSRIESVNVIC